MTLYYVVEIKPNDGFGWMRIDWGTQGHCWTEYEKVRNRRTEHLLPTGPFEVRMRRIHNALIAEATVCGT